MACQTIDCMSMCLVDGRKSFTDVTEHAVNAYRHRKMQLNAEKYPPDLCRGSSAKYHLYSKG